MLFDESTQVGRVVSLTTIIIIMLFILYSLLYSGVEASLGL